MEIDEIVSEYIVSNDVITIVLRIYTPIHPVEGTELRRTITLRRESKSCGHSISKADYTTMPRLRWAFVFVITNETPQDERCHLRLNFYESVVPPR